MLFPIVQCNSCKAAVLPIKQTDMMMELPINVNVFVIMGFQMHINFKYHLQEGEDLDSCISSVFQQPSVLESVNCSECVYTCPEEVLVYV